jgi:hypothetical protein
MSILVSYYYHAELTRRSRRMLSVLVSELSGVEVASNVIILSFSLLLTLSLNVPAR